MKIQQRLIGKMRNNDIMIMEKMNYMTPVIEIIDIEVEQAVLSASTEELGVKSPDLEW